mmetsp:Transcript_10056/g.31858  ORF Transcript_10056/g.31858 Transcript_10056/m.31858 type:complete len:227 (-) Transcript_10056:907-1587(-)
MVPPPVGVEPKFHLQRRRVVQRRRGRRALGRRRRVSRVQGGVHGRRFEQRLLVLRRQHLRQRHGEDVVVREQQTRRLHALGLLLSPLGRRRLGVQQAVRRGPAVVLWVEVHLVIGDGRIRVRVAINVVAALAATRRRLVVRVSVRRAVRPLSTSAALVISKEVVIAVLRLGRVGRRAASLCQLVSVLPLGLASLAMLKGGPGTGSLVAQASAGRRRRGRRHDAKEA